MAEAPIGGYVAPGFKVVRDAFAANFAQHGDVGAGVAVHHRGELVVDLWGGTADPGTGTPYGEDTLQLVFSTTKGATAVCANLLAQRGELDVAAPVAHYWPEFAASGKESIRVSDLLCHRAGLPVVDGTVELHEVLDWHPACARLAAQEPIWPAGTAHGYHAVTYGHLVGEVVRRVSGKSLGTFFADEVADPLGLEFWIGLPEAHESRVAPLIPVDLPTDPDLLGLLMAVSGPDTLLGRALSFSGALESLRSPLWNTRPVHAAEIPAANAIANARSVSKMYAALIGEVDGVRLFTPERVEAARTVHAEGPDQVLAGSTTRFGLGFMVSGEFAGMGGPGTFGHPGAGGSLGFCDPERELAFGYVMNRMQQNLAGDPRTIGLIDAVYASL